jgi:hypothetical protein
LLAVTLALLTTAMAQDFAPMAGMGTSQTAFIAANGVYSAGGAGFAFPVIPGQNYNYDDIYSAAGPDVAVAAFGAVAANSKTVTKNQDANVCCGVENASPTINLERIGLPQQVALGAGAGSRATNTVTITTQQK